MPQTDKNVLYVRRYVQQRRQKGDVSMTFWSTEELSADIEDFRIEDGLSRAEFIRNVLSQYAGWRKGDRGRDLFSSLNRQELTEEIMSALADESSVEGKETNRKKKKPG